MGPLQGSNNFLYLNPGGRWDGFHCHGLELSADGALRLLSLPALEGDPPDGLDSLTPVQIPSGMTVAPDGTIYFTDPQGRQLLRQLPCPLPPDDVPPACNTNPCGPSGQVVELPNPRPAWLPAPCIGGPSSNQFGSPRGVLYHPKRGALYVVDGSRQRVQVFNPQSYQLMDTWGQPGGGPGEFGQPGSITADPDGFLYIADHQNGGSASGRVQKFDPYGRFQPGFWEQVQQSLKDCGLSLSDPVEVAAASFSAGTRIYILDRATCQVFAFTPQGELVKIDAGGGQMTELPPFGGGQLVEPMGLAAGARGVYVGDNTHRRIFHYSPDGVYAGEALNYDAPVAALALDNQADLLALPRPETGPLLLDSSGGYARQGALWGGPFTALAGLPKEWHRFKADLDPLAEGAHIQFYCFVVDPDAPGHSVPYAAAKGAPALPPPSPSLLPALTPVPEDNPPWGDSAVDLLDALSSPPDLTTGWPGGARFAGRWVRMPLDAAEGFILAIQTDSKRPGQRANLRSVWLGADFSGEGLSSPALRQVRLDFDHETYLKNLPPIYAQDTRSRQYLERFLGLFESLFDDVEGEINRLPAIFDPTSARVDFLDWLSGWLAVDLHDDWPEQRRRDLIARAFAIYGLRGTPEGLRQAAELFAGVHIEIEEPLLEANWWAMAGSDSGPMEQGASVLGVSTVLAPAESQGAVLGSTATMDHSYLIEGSQVGEPLFMDYAYRFTVRLYQGCAYSREKLDALRALIDREMPAHLVYQICVVEPRMRVGYQSRLGVNSIVAGAAQPNAFGSISAQEDGQVLGGDPGGQVGMRSEIGKTTRLG